MLHLSIYLNMVPNIMVTCGQKCLHFIIFNEIKKEGLLNSEVGKRYIEQVIGCGGQCDPNELLENFLGRKPNQKAFLKDLGL